MELLRSLGVGWPLACLYSSSQGPFLLWWRDAWAGERKDVRRACRVRGVWVVGACGATHIFMNVDVFGGGVSENLVSQKTA